MVPLADLLWPILLSAAAMFLASLGLRRWLPQRLAPSQLEGALAAEIRQLGLSAGEFALPLTTAADGSASPSHVLMVRPLGDRRSMVVWSQWFVMLLGIALLTGYLSGLALLPGSNFNAVFRFATVVAFLAHGTTSVHNSIWRGEAWRSTRKALIDSLAYGLMTGAIFAWVWPSA
jgi:hypothetical protein